ncbi:MAG: ATP-dependent 6-phosphofructokinase [candidate division Zixibacteria bacterium]|nr:ATP-dependent 6-phosphofructokinase [candidate division Zixibacteria bacterium]
MPTHIGILTSGGDCPGLNAVIRAVVVKAIKRNGWRVTGILEGWKGLTREGTTRPMTLPEVSGILGLGGTILKTSRTNPLSKENGVAEVLQKTAHLKLDAVIAIGGEDTMGVAYALHEKGLPLIGVPKTIDNDLPGTDYSFGFDTAVNTVVQAIDRVRTTTEAHKRVMVVEVMGRHSGWIALQGGIAGGADAILIPERPTDLDEVCSLVVRRHEGGKDFSIVVVAEGAKVTADRSASSDGTLILQDLAKDDFGHVRLGGIGQVLAREIEKRTGYETREVMLGHVQRGGSPTAFDRYLCTRFGLKAVELIEQKQFGKMVSLQGNQIVAVSLADVAGKTKTVPADLFEEAAVFFG